MRRPLSSRLALMAGAGAVFYGAAATLAFAQPASTSAVHVDTRALDQLGYTATKRPANSRDRQKLKAPAERGPSAATAPAAASSHPAPSQPVVAPPTTAAPPPAARPPAAQQAATAEAERPAAPARTAAAPPPAAPAAPIPAPAPPAAAAAAPARPVPPPVVAPPPTVAAPQATALAPPPAAQRRGETRIAFPAGSTDLPPNARGELDQAARRLAGDEALRMQLNAYAAENGDQSSQARRVSLSRALAVRAYLIDKGVRSTRLDVRALGKPQDDGPQDRVDLVVVGR